MAEYVLKSERITCSITELVTGTFRHQYFKRPMIPVLQSVPPEVVMEIPEERIQNAKYEEEEEEPKSKAVEIQTDYRESQTQTDPYTPNFIVERGRTPEVMAIEHLKFG